MKRARCYGVRISGFFEKSIDILKLQEYNAGIDSEPKGRLFMLNALSRNQ